ncbi:MAG: zinc ribbon domain-containing protein [Casimicrobiaceae bacterium]
MPIYEYRCSACGHELEALQKLSEPRLLNCPACHADALVKKVSAAGFQLKGSGWYVTDFRNGGKSKAAAKADSGTKAESSAAEGGGDSKSDTKADTSTQSATPAKADSAAKTETAAKPAAAKAESAPSKPTPSSSGSSSD